MGDPTIQVPAGYIPTLRVATMKDVRFWSDAVAGTLKEIEETAERGDESKFAFRQDDFTNEQEALACAAALIPQIPAEAEPTEDVEIRGTAMALHGVADEAIRHLGARIKDETVVDPICTRSIQRHVRELEWWMEQLEAVMPPARAETVAMAEAA